jgi:hypothetical protein
MDDDQFDPIVPTEAMPKRPQEDIATFTRLTKRILAVFERKMMNTVTFPVAEHMGERLAEGGRFLLTRMAREEIRAIATGNLGLIPE